MWCSIVWEFPGNIWLCAHEKKTRGQSHFDFLLKSTEITSYAYTAREFPSIWNSPSHWSRVSKFSWEYLISYRLFGYFFVNVYTPSLGCLLCFWGHHPSNRNNAAGVVSFSDPSWSCQWWLLVMDLLYLLDPSLSLLFATSVFLGFVSLSVSCIRTSRQKNLCASLQMIGR